MWYNPPLSPCFKAFPHRISSPYEAIRGFPSPSPLAPGDDQFAFCLDGLQVWYVSSKIISNYQKLLVLVVVNSKGLGRGVGVLAGNHQSLVNRHKLKTAIVKEDLLGTDMVRECSLQVHF